eukprot:gene711-477_t
MVSWSAVGPGRPVPVAWGCGRGLKESGKLFTVIHHMRQGHLDLALLTESHCTEPDTFRSEGYTVVHSADAKRDESGKVKQTFTGITLVIDPLFMGAPQVFGIYAPHSEHDKDERRAFWNSIETEIENTPTSTDLL